MLVTRAFEPLANRIESMKKKKNRRWNNYQYELLLELTHKKSRRNVKYSIDSPYDDIFHYIFI